MIATTTIAYIALFVASGLTDVFTMRIPNVLVGALVVLFALACLVWPPQSILVGHVVPAIAVFVLSAGLFFLGKFGGGDVKLLSAAVLWMGMAQLGPFLLALAAYGLAAILVFAVFRRQVVAALAWTEVRIGRAVPLPLSLESGRAIPYGVVIAAAALTVSPGVLVGGQG